MKSTEILHQLLGVPSETTTIEGRFTNISTYPKSMMPIQGNIQIDNQRNIIYIEMHNGAIIGTKISDLKPEVEIIFEGNDGEIYTKGNNTQCNT